MKAGYIAFSVARILRSNNKDSKDDAQKDQINKAPILPDT
jgi:hypothetical protein